MSLYAHPPGTTRPKLPEEIVPKRPSHSLEQAIATAVPGLSALAGFKIEQPVIEPIAEVAAIEASPVVEESGQDPLPLKPLAPNKKK